MKYLSETPEFAACVRRKRIEAWLCLPMRIVNAALGVGTCRRCGT